MIKRILAAAAASLAILGGSVTAQEQVAVDTRGMTPGLPPPGFEFSRTGDGRHGQWVVAQEPSAASGYVIAQTDSDATSYRFPLAIYKPATAKDAEVTIRFRPVSGKVDQAGGIAVRLQTPGDYYVVRANALENNVRLYRVVNGKREQLANANVRVATNEWHTLGLKAQGYQFTVSFNGQPLFTARDGTFAGPGKVALWTKADSVTQFEGLTITPLN